MAKICKIYHGTNDFYDTSLALYYLYKGSEAIQKHPVAQDARSFGNIGYAKEFATVKMFASRRVGNTQAIVELCNHLEEHWLILDRDLACAKRIKIRCQNFHKHKILQSRELELISTNVKLTFGSINSIDRYRGFKLRGIIVDSASTIKEEYLNRVYELQPAMQDYPTEHFLFVS